MSSRTLLALGAFATAIFLAGCETTSPDGLTSAQRKANAELQTRARNDNAIFRSLGGWKKSTYRNKEVLALATPENTELHVSIADQRAYVLVKGAIAMEFPVATGKSTHPTPTGTFKILSKEKDYKSNLYGKIFDSLDAISVNDADIRVDPIPPGGRFVGAGMPYWMRLTQTGVGLHVGYVAGVPASHGCVRLPAKVAPEIFEMLPVGAKVVIAQAPPAF